MSRRKWFFSQKGPFAGEIFCAFLLGAGIGFDINQIGVLQYRIPAREICNPVAFSLTGKCQKCCYRYMCNNIFEVSPCFSELQSSARLCKILEDSILTKLPSCKMLQKCSTGWLVWDKTICSDQNCHIPGVSSRNKSSRKVPKCLI